MTAARSSRLIIANPVIGIPILIIIIVIFVLRAKFGSATKGNEWSTTAGSNWTPHQNVVHPPPQAEPLRGKLEALRRTDPGFSIVVFEDFLYFLYAEMQRARGAGAGEALAAYVADGARAVLHNDGRVAEVNGIIIGSMTYETRRRRRAGRRAARRRGRVQLRRALPAAGRAALLREGPPPPQPRGRGSLARSGQGPHAELPELRRPALQHARHDVQLLPHDRPAGHEGLGRRQPPDARARAEGPAPHVERRRGGHEPPDRLRSQRAGRVRADPGEGRGRDLVADASSIASG